MSGPDSGDSGRTNEDDSDGPVGPRTNDPGDSSRDGSRSADEAAHRDDEVTIEDDGFLRWFVKTDDGNVVLVRDILSSVAIVAAVGLLLFGISGVWPPLVAIESPSMEPNMMTGDLVFVADDDRFVGDGAVAGTGVVTYQSAQESGHEKFDNGGDVIIFRPDGDERTTPIIHRAHFWVEDGENWVDTKADEEIIGDVTCDEVQTCPAEHDGFVTKGDANSGYDQHQSGARTDVVKPDWVTGKAMVRVPWLGHVRLFFDSMLGGMLAPVPTGAQAGLVGIAGAAGASSVGAAAIRRRYRE
ncbi:S26 family signal peptidase [Natrialbaceae archaeon A-arb3/5]